MAIPAGSKGGYFTPLRNTGLDLLSFVTKLPEVYREHELNLVKTIGLYVNNDCNLTCEHCYYQTPTSYRSNEGVDTQTLLAALDAGLRTSAELYAFVGKEVFLPGPNGAEKTIAAMKHLATSRSSLAIPKIGVVTNGILLHHYLDELSDIGLDFLDISIDGANANANDTLRGDGSFETSIQNLDCAVAAKAAAKIFVASTLCKSNLGTIVNLLDLHAKIGVRHFCITPIAALQNAAQYLSLSELLSFLTDTIPRKAAVLSSSTPIELIVDIDSYVVCSAVHQIAELMSGSTVEIDQLNNILLRKTFASVELVIRISLPDPCNSYGCVTHDGLYFDKSGCLFMKSGYEKHALGDIKTSSLDKLVIQHEHIANNLPELLGPTLFQQPSHQVLASFEETDFYWEAEIA